MVTDANEICDPFVMYTNVQSFYLTLKTNVRFRINYTLILKSSGYKNSIQESISNLLHYTKM